MLQICIRNSFDSDGFIRRARLQQRERLTKCPQFVKPVPGIGSARSQDVVLGDFHHPLSLLDTHMFTRNTHVQTTPDVLTEAVSIGPLPQNQR